MNRAHGLSGYDLLLAIGGLILWSSGFVLLYAVLSLGCMGGWQEVTVAGTNLLSILLALFWLAHLAALAWLQWYGLRLWRGDVGADRKPARFLGALTCLIALVGIIATLFTGFPVLVLPPCA